MASWSKKILFASKNSLPDYTDGAKVVFHFKTTAASDPEVVIDDSRQMDQPMELILGKKFKLEVWEEFIKTMRVGEIASFTVPKNLLLSYPLVSKSLRNLKNKIDTPSHCCGLISQSLGYPDLDRLMEKPQDLVFTLELLKVENCGEYEKESWAMSEDEKLESIPVLKSKGNAHYAAGEYGQAEKDYCEALGRLEQMMIREKPDEEEWLNLEKFKIPLLLNYAQCKLIQKDFYSVIEHTTSVLSRYPENVKALFRRGKAHIGVWNPDEATEDFKKAMDLDKSLTTAVQRELKNIENLKKMKDKEDREKLVGKMFPD